MMLRLASSLLCYGSAVANADSDYTLQDSYVGEDFFSSNNWNFFTASDPTDGVVNYVDKDTALSGGLINATADRVYMGADMVTAGDSHRKSVRIESNQNYD